MEYDYLSDAQHKLIESFEKQFLRNKMLSEYQHEVLEDIFKRAAESVEWSR
jgi:preprotein translocase subunit SecA